MSEFRNIYVAGYRRMDVILVCSATIAAIGIDNTGGNNMGFSWLFIIVLIIIAIIVSVIVLISRSSKKSQREFEVYKNSMQSGQVPNPYNQANTSSFAQDGPSGGFAVLGFFIPMVGLILYIVWNSTLPFRARSAGKGALAGFITYIVAIITISVLLVFLR